ncbi:MAG: citramalate synthase [Endomicrobiaceae bacterium]|nr:citramalate synthase [Endomicrobiaceae bacterium]
MKKISIFDTTLRDGSQGAGISFSVEDKLKIALALDAFGISYIEGGWPGSNPKDEEFFKLAKNKLKKSKLVAFSSTRRKNIKAKDDANINKIISSGVKCACIFGKTWDFHVIHALNTTLEENLNMISDTISYLKSKKIEVIYDAEHFFDGYLSNTQYAIKTIESAVKAGVEFVCLCETNGGMLPTDVQKIVKEIKERFPNTKFGIHTHNDSGCATANSLIAVESGCEMVQGTINGIGERCGNANLCSIIPSLQLKKGYHCVPPKSLVKLMELSMHIYEIANLVPNDYLPYVGRNAFAHKAGIHVSAIEKNSKTYEHVNPQEVGNIRRILVSDLSGKSNIISKADELEINIDSKSEKIKDMIKAVKDKENQGYQYEDADGSFFILTKKIEKQYSDFFTLKGYRVSVEKNGKGEIISEATVKLDVNGKEEHTVAEGDGPVNALDQCLRKALMKFYPEIEDVLVIDFKVRVINSDANTSAKVRVLIESKDKKHAWGTIGVSENIIDASWQALSDSVEYKLLKNKIGNKK